MTKPTVRSHDAIRFGEIIRRLRTDRGWTIIKLAHRARMNPNYLGSLEKGGNMPSLATILELADVFNVSAGDLVRELEEGRKKTRR